MSLMIADWRSFATLIRFGRPWPSRPSIFPPTVHFETLQTILPSPRRARGVEVWDSLRSLGRSGVIELVERCCRHARRFADGLRSAGYQVINEVTLNQVLVAFGDAETTHNVVTELQTEGTCWCGVTVWDGRLCELAYHLGRPRTWTLSAA